MVLPRRQQISQYKPGHAESRMEKTFRGGLSNRDQDHRENYPIRAAHEIPPGAADTLNIQLTSCEPAVRVRVLLAGLSSHLNRQCGCRRLFIPANLFQVIANVLLVE